MQAESILHAAGDGFDHGIADCQLVRIGGKERCRNNDLVSRLKNREEGNEEGFHRTGGDDNLFVGVYIQPRIAFEFFSNGQPQIVGSGHVRVVDIPALNRFNDGFFGACRGVKIGSAYFHVDDVTAFSLHALRLGEDFADASRKGNGCHSCVRDSVVHFLLISYKLDMIDASVQAVPTMTVHFTGIQVCFGYAIGNCGLSDGFCDARGGCVAEKFGEHVVRC